MSKKETLWSEKAKVWEELNDLTGTLQELRKKKVKPNSRQVRQKCGNVIRVDALNRHRLRERIFQTEHRIAALSRRAQEIDTRLEALNRPRQQKVIIHYIGGSEPTSYKVTSPDQARDEADRSAAQTAFEMNQTISMGKIIAEPVWE